MAPKGGQPNRPNVLVIICDQLRQELLGCYGGSMVRTPNMDALAADGTVFENAYTPTAICSPARASLMTGLYAHKHHMFNNSTPKYSYCEHLRPDMTMVQDWLADETDYETAYYGKWHIGPPQDLMDSRFEHTQRPPYPGRVPAFAEGHGHPTTKLGPLVKSFANGLAGTLDLPMEEFPDVMAARYSQAFLRGRSGERPFALYCSLPGPHGPRFVPDEFGIRYDPKDIPDWPNRYDDFDGKPISQKKLRLIARMKQPERPEETLKELLACGYSYLELVDSMVGEVVGTLKQLGLYDDTAIILTADHGDMAGSHGFLSKGSYMYEEIYRIPMLFKPPGGSAVRRVSEPVNLMDATATVAHIVEGEERRDIGSGELDGRSFLPLARGQTDWYKAVNYSEYHGDWYGHYSARMVTDGSWKLVWNLSDLNELYDLDEDPHELRNLFYDPSHQKPRDRYLEVLVEEARRFQDAHLSMMPPEMERRLADAITGPLQLSP
jgi:arylsulfatase A-like enzyme